MDCDLNFIIKGEGLLKVTGSGYKDTVLHRDIVRTGH